MKRIDDDAVLVSGVLRRLAEETARRRDLPEARFFWLTSQWMPNPAVQARALKPMGILQVLAHSLVAICWALLITWKWPAIKGWLQTPDLVTRVLDALAGTGGAPMSLLVVGGLLCVTSVVILHSAFAED